MIQPMERTEDVQLVIIVVRVVAQNGIHVRVAMLQTIECSMELYAFVKM